VKVAEHFFGPEIDAALSGIRCDNSITAIPCGQKNKISEIIQSQIVTPSLPHRWQHVQIKNCDNKKRTDPAVPARVFRCGCVSVIPSAIFSSMQHAQGLRWL